MEQKQREELDQLKLTSKESKDKKANWKRKQNCILTVAALRCQTANYMQSHVEDFLPFSTNPNMGAMYTPDKFGKYCNDI
ncbi:hypothetical protein Celaphus_00009985, partial [Cervus elaphus hippelaphus]